MRIRIFFIPAVIRIFCLFKEFLKIRSNKRFTPKTRLIFFMYTLIMYKKCNILTLTNQDFLKRKTNIVFLFSYTSYFDPYLYAEVS